MSAINCNIDIKHLSRVEGHGNLKIRIKDAIVKEARWEVVETARFFEKMLAGKKFNNLPFISSRICGICSISHNLTAIRAIENCFGFTPSVQTQRLRLLLKHMETLQSHILHIFFLAAPDYFGEDSFLPFSVSHPDVTNMALRLKMLANDLADEVGGRRLHPTTPVVGGFSKIPGKKNLGKFKYRLQSSLLDLIKSSTLLKKFEIPQFSRETEYVASIPRIPTLL